MVATKKLVGSGCLLTILIVTGSILLFRSCLAKYDERAGLLPATVFTNDSAEIIFSLVSYDKATSYSSGRGMTHKTVNTSYFIQINDINTGQKLKQKEIKNHDDIKEWPVRILGSATKHVWVFMGELLAFDPFTLRTIADISILEKKNPALAGKFPHEEKFYQFNVQTGNICFTATDGSKWIIDSDNFAAVLQTNDINTDPYKQSLDSIELLIKLNTTQQDTIFGRKNLSAQNDELRAASERLRKLKTSHDQLQSAINTLQRINPGYSQMFTNLDTVNNKWTGVYTSKELSELPSYIYLRRAYDETARRFIVKGTLENNNRNEPLLEKTSAQIISDAVYLEGGILIDKSTAAPFHLKDNGYLITHKDKIGKEGKIILSLIDGQGKRVWTTETRLSKWMDWKLLKNKLIIFGQDNPELTGDECNVMLIVDTNNGSHQTYDYFNDRE